MQKTVFKMALPAVLLSGLGACANQNGVAVAGSPTAAKSHKVLPKLAMHAPVRLALAPRPALAAPMVEEAPSADALYIVRDGQTAASVVVAPGAGVWEKQAATDLVKYIGLMSGATPKLVEGTSAGDGPAIVIGQAALTADPNLATMLAGVAKKNPVVRADAIAMQRQGNRIFLAGTNDESHYFAVSQLLQSWGCRWYLPTEFGECIPDKKTLYVNKLDTAYAPPFEIRHYWLSWNAERGGSDEFRRRNFMTETSMAGMGHALGSYTKNVIPPGKTMFNISFSDPKTAEEVAKQIEPDYAKGVPSISLAIEDGNYTNDSAQDKALQGEWDKYTLKPSNTDAMLTLYNNVGKILHAKYPNSPTRIGGMAYANVTLPPRKITKVEPNVVMWIAPIDIDPNHAMDDPKSPPKMEYRQIMEKWAKLLDGRLALYDYDQGQLVWRDLPNPSQDMFARDVKIYRDAHILGIGTESRGATATTFLNLFFRGQLMWNPDADKDAMLAEFYPKFYGPAAKPMSDYWGAIFAAWKNTGVTEHEFMDAPAIYTPELVAGLGKSLAAAEAAVAPLQGNGGRNEKLYVERMKFTRLSYDILQNYTAMAHAAASDNDYKGAAVYGAKALAARESLTDMNGTFTTYRKIGEAGSAWFPGDVDYMKELAGLTDGTKGTLIAQTPLNWAFHRDTSVPVGWTYTGMEGGTPKDATFATQATTPANGWKTLRSDVYLQGQGILTPDGQASIGHYWYQTSVDLKADQTTGKVHLMFPGLFNEGWLYVNGQLVGHRDFSEPWWLQDYKFQYDADLTGKLKAGKNTIALRGFNPHHFGGMFRRPFLYRAAG